MWLYFRLFLLALRLLRRERQDLILENLALRQQLAVFERRGHRPRLGPADRRFWSRLARGWQPWRRHLLVVQPDTVVRWHRTAWRILCGTNIRSHPDPCTPARVGEPLAGGCAEVVRVPSRGRRAARGGPFARRPDAGERRPPASAGGLSPVPPPRPSHRRGPALLVDARPLGVRVARGAGVRPRRHRGALAPFRLAPSPGVEEPEAGAGTPAS